jgi:hypothetical protein
MWLLLLGLLALPGCGSVQEIILDEVQASAKESIEQAVDEAVDGVVDELLDFGGLTDDEEPSSD